VEVLTDGQVVEFEYEGHTVCVKLGSFLNIAGTFFRILEARYNASKSTELSSFGCQYAVGDTDCLKQYGVNSKTIYEDIADIPAKVIATAILESRRRP